MTTLPWITMTITPKDLVHGHSGLFMKTITEMTVFTCMPSASLAKKRTTSSDGQSAMKSTCSSSTVAPKLTKTMLASSWKAPPSLLLVELPF